MKRRTKKRQQREKGMRNISRVDQERKNQYGWLVRVMRDGVMYQKFFSDNMYRSETGSLRAAKQHRNELLRLYPKPERGNAFNRVMARNTTGYPGVSKSGSYRKGHYYEAWQAYWTLPNGKRMNKKFVFSPTGRSERAALRLALKARREGVETIHAITQAKMERRERLAARMRASKRGKARR